MKLLRVKVQNFGSYDLVELEFKNRGLTLISGDTGVGKSTILDFVCWTLFGTTSKNGAVDDIRSWFSEEDTLGACEVETSGGNIVVCRRRGINNDLFYQLGTISGASGPIRGKDLNDTQKFINQVLGFDANLYLQAAYIHQFSEVDRFFDVKSKDRREFVEQIANLELSIKLFEKSKDNRLETKKQLEAVLNKLISLEATDKAVYDKYRSLFASSNDWEKTHKLELEAAAVGKDNFEEARELKATTLKQEIMKLKEDTNTSAYFDKQLEQLQRKEKKLQYLQEEHIVTNSEVMRLRREIKALKDNHSEIYGLVHRRVCPTCKAPVNENIMLGELTNIDSQVLEKEEEKIGLESKLVSLSERIKEIGDLKKEYKRIISDCAANDRILSQIEGLKKELQDLKNLKNAYTENYEALDKAVNPISVLLNKAAFELQAGRHQLDSTKLISETLNKRFNELTWLYDKSFELRGWQMEQATIRLTNIVNQNLEKYFDASLRINIKIPESDKIEVEINNSGYACNYSQLSGGERALLSLVLKFAVITLIEDKAGISFSTVMLDEVLNGLSDDLKIKAFAFLQSLSAKYENIFLIDHCEAFQNMFENKIKVSKIGNVSRIESES